MKKTPLAILMVAGISLAACQQQTSDPLAVQEVQLSTAEQQQAYALGSNIGGYIANQLEAQQAVGIELDEKLIVQGLLAGLQDKSQLADDVVQQQLQALQTAMREKQQEKDAASAEENKAAGLAYLEENKTREGVSETESGLQYEVLTTGDGLKPTAEDTVKVHYHGTLIDGTVFDSSVDRGQPAVFPLKRVISGWTEGLQLMSVGSKFRFHIPSDLAYGTRSTGKIGPNSTLVFDVELLDIESGAAVK